MGHDADKQLDRAHLAAIADADAREAHTESSPSVKILATVLVSLPVMTAVLVFPGALAAIDTGLSWLLTNAVDAVTTTWSWLTHFVTSLF